MIRLGNAVYREAQIPLMWERGHAALVYRFDGSASKDDILNPHKYKLCEVLDFDLDDLTTMTDLGDLEYWYCYTNTERIGDDSVGYVRQADYSQDIYA